MTFVFAALGSPTAVAPQHQTAIVLALLLTLASVFLVGAALIAGVHRYLRRRAASLSEPPRRGARCDPSHGRLFQPSVFHCPNRWVAVRSAHPQAVQAALGLHNATPCSWTDGMSRSSEHRVFIAPPVHGWILVVGSLLPDPADDVDACFRFLQRLSRALGEVQFFSLNRAVGHHAWARFESGRALRGYAWAGETLWNQGNKTWAERKLGLRCYDYSQEDSRGLFAQLERSRINAERVPLLASMWSLDPSSIDDTAIADALGIAGDLSRVRRH